MPKGFEQVVTSFMMCSIKDCQAVLRAKATPFAQQRSAAHVHGAASPTAKVPRAVLS